MKRPFGITFIALIWGLAGISYMILGLQLTTAVTFGPVPAGQGTWFWGWVVVFTGLVFWAAAGAAWTLQAWAWQLGMILAAFGLIEAFFIMIGTGNINQAAAATAWPLFLFWYLHRPSTMRAFGLGADEA